MCTCANGVELYLWCGRWCARPCPKCDGGARILALWVQDGPWRHLTDAEIREIMSRQDESQASDRSCGA